MSLLIKEEDTNPYQMEIHWKTMATIKDNCQYKDYYQSLKAIHD